jgi:hypothetical protein
MLMQRHVGNVLPVSFKNSTNQSTRFVNNLSSFVRARCAPKLVGKRDISLPTGGGTGWAFLDGRGAILLRVRYLGASPVLVGRFPFALFVDTITEWFLKTFQVIKPLVE